MEFASGERSYVFDVTKRTKWNGIKTPLPLVRTRGESVLQSIMHVTTYFLDKMIAPNREIALHLYLECGSSIIILPFESAPLANSRSSSL